MSLDEAPRAWLATSTEASRRALAPYLRWFGRAVRQGSSRARPAGQVLPAEGEAFLHNYGAGWRSLTARLRPREELPMQLPNATAAARRAPEVVLLVSGTLRGFRACMPSLGTRLVDPNRAQVTIYSPAPEPSHAIRLTLR